MYGGKLEICLGNDIFINFNLLITSFEFKLPNATGASSPSSRRLSKYPHPYLFLNVKSAQFLHNPIRTLL